jgi:O-acetyl-ADP-ribose deacetylase (regulator of RNase III)
MIRRKTTKTMWSAARPFGLFAVAVLAISAGAPVQAQAAAPTAIEDANEKIANQVGSIFNQAIRYERAKKYELALQKLAEIEKILQEK